MSARDRKLICQMKGIPGFYTSRPVQRTLCKALGKKFERSSLPITEWNAVLVHLLHIKAQVTHYRLKTNIEGIKLICHTLVVRCRLFSVSGWFWSSSGFFFFFFFFSFSIFILTTLKKREGWKLQRSPKHTTGLDHAYLGKIAKPWNSASAGQSWNTILSFYYRRSKID